METNPNSLDGMFETLNYYDLWYKWFIKSPSNKELMKFKQMNKQQQIKGVPFGTTYQKPLYSVIHK